MRNVRKTSLLLQAVEYASFISSLALEGLLAFFLLASAWKLNRACP